MSENNSKFYDWNKTLSYMAPVTLVISARGMGKTFGLRWQCLREANQGYKWVEVARHKTELPSLMDGYFTKLCATFPKLAKHWEFKCEGGKGYRRKANSKDKWELIVYFVALTEMQSSKKRTFTNVKRIIYDEAILDKIDKLHRYLPNEWELLAGVVDSCTRQNPNDPTMKPAYLYMLGNAVDLVNPVFRHFKINDVPKYGYSWFDSKFLLVHFVRDNEYGAAKEDNTLAGRMLKGTRAGQLAAYNEMELLLDDDISKKPANAKIQFNLICNGSAWGVWYSKSEGYYYVCSKTIDTAPGYALTLADGSPDLISLKLNRQFLNSFATFIYQGMVKFETQRLKTDFMTALALYGIR